MPRPIWKGHITFGLVNVPVTLYSGEERQDIQFHLLDSRDTRRVRYQRVNEETGEEVPWGDIVKGFEYDGGQYVLLSDEEMKGVNPELTRRIEIEDFVSQTSIDPVYFDKPYLLEPGKGGDKGYALLRETLRLSDRIGIARVVIRSREHLAALLVRGDMLVLNLIRFPQELRDPAEIKLPDTAAIKMSSREIDLAVQLVDSMTTEWDPHRYHDEFRESLMTYIQDKVKRGEISAGSVPKPPEETADEDENVVDLMAYLKKSVTEARKQRDQGDAKPKAPRKSAPGKATTRKSARKKRSA